ncbi:MAG: PIN domain-containing protein [Methanosarcinales archaeon]
MLKEHSNLLTTVNVLEETFYKSIVLKTFKKIGTLDRYTSKERYITHPEDYKDIISFSEEFITFLTDNMYLSILDLNYTIFRISLEISRNYRLLPNDALIAATCKHYEIKRITTLESDFKRVESLEVVEP